jgi:opacity protein-like surface antigen
MAPVLASAQDKTPEVEVFGGYSYLRADEDLIGIGDDNESLHGWNGSIAYSLNDWFGVEADFAGHYGSDRTTRIITPAFDPLPGFPTVGFDFDADARQHTFLFGPRVTARGDRVTGFGHALFGGANIHREIRTTPVTPVPPGINPLSIEDSETSFAMAVGGGIDINVSDHVAIRAIQADYLMTRYEDERSFGSGADSQHNARFSVGIVFRFGNR